MEKFKSAIARRLPAVAGVSTAALAAGSAFASGGGGVDVGDVVSAINGAIDPVAKIGSAVLIVMVGIKVYKWIRRAM